MDGFDRMEWRDARDETRRWGVRKGDLSKADGVGDDDFAFDDVTMVNTWFDVS